MTPWVSHLFDQHNRLLTGGIGDPEARVYAPTINLWNAFAHACRDCADTYNQSATGPFRDRPVLLAPGAVAYSISISVDDPKQTHHFAELTFDKHHTYIKVLLPGTADTGALKLPIMMTRDGELRITYLGRALPIEEAARLVMTPVLFGVQADLEGPVVSA